MSQMNDIFSLHSSTTANRRETEMSLAEFLEACRDDPGCYANPAERMLKAIGEPEVIDTAKDAVWAVSF